MLSSRIFARVFFFILMFHCPGVENKPIDVLSSKKGVLSTMSVQVVVFDTSIKEYPAR